MNLRSCLPCLALLAFIPSSGQLRAQAAPSPCSVRSTTYLGWKAREIANRWVTLTVVPQLGGRLMQVTFQGHPYLFVNPRYQGRYIPPAQAHGSWINYGGDKVWPLPEGSEDDHHWVLASTAIDDLPYAERAWTDSAACGLELTGQPDSITGIQYIRTIRLSAESPEIHFRAAMINATTHPIRWSMQTVTQYDLTGAPQTGGFNHDLWAYTLVNPVSRYPGGYHVRSGLADDPAFSVADGRFALHWLPLANEVWLDSRAGWLAVVDKSSGFGMVERFTPQDPASYPDRASVIFYQNGPSVRFEEHDTPTLPPLDLSNNPPYLEAEINSPLVSLRPGQQYALETTWNPVRLSDAPASVTRAGVVTKAVRLCGSQSSETPTLTADLSVFYGGSLAVVFLDAHGQQRGRRVLAEVEAGQQVSFKQKLSVPSRTRTLQLLLLDRHGHSLGALGSGSVSSTSTP